MSYIQLPDIKMFYRVVVQEKEVSGIDQKLPALIVLHGGPGIVDHQIEYDAWSKFSKLNVQVVNCLSVTVKKWVRLLKKILYNH